MSFWIAALAMAAAAVALLLLPLFRAKGSAEARKVYDLAIYRDQLTELERDLARGVLNADQAAAARTEIERRMLNVAEEDVEKPGAARSGRALIGFLVAAVPLCALALYWPLGNPGLPGHPLAAREAPAPAPGLEGENMDGLTARLAQRLEQDPTDLDGWQLLARTYSQIGRYDQAADAYRKAIANGDEAAQTRAALGEMLTAAANGLIGPEARSAFAEALERDPGDPRALYYGGLAYAQADRMEEALQVWRGLAANTPEDAPWKALLDGQIARTEAALKGEPLPDLAETTPAPRQTPAPAPDSQPGVGPGPSQADVAAAAELSNDERQAFIRSMVDRLAARLEEEPDDLAGWLRLTRAYTVLGEREQAVAAVEQAAVLARSLPADAPEHGAIAQAKAQLGL